MQYGEGNLTQQNADYYSLIKIWTDSLKRPDMSIQFLKGNGLEIAFYSCSFQYRNASSKADLHVGLPHSENSCR